MEIKKKVIRADLARETTKNRGKESLVGTKTKR
jgi:hypothetical protein